MLLGYNGTQHRNYTTVMNYWTYPRTAGGGGFSTTVFSLQFLYEQYELRKNIWTCSNMNFDLCRYTGCRFYFYRHPWADFVVTAQLMYPMTLNFNDYMTTQPLQMLLAQKHFVIPSFQYKKGGKPYVRKTFKPPKQMTNKWFFQDSFSEKPLLLLRASVCNLKMPFLGPMGENELVTLDCINIQKSYHMGNWGKTTTQGYEPLLTFIGTSTKYIKNGKTQTFNIQKPNIYYNNGWFSKELLTADKVQFSNNTEESTFTPATYQVRYNPKQDTGKGNTVWLCSTLTDRYDQPTTDRILMAREQPLWILLYGFVDYLIQLRPKVETTKIYYLLIETDFFRPQIIDDYIGKTYLIIDKTFINGQGPYNSTPTDFMIKNWYPTLEHQQKSICNIVTAGPYTYKPDTAQNNWELHYRYSFYFKWGGSQDTDKQVTDPGKKTEYPVPDTLQQGIQITDPQQIIPETILHSWDYRRDYITKTALKRMSEHLPVESIVPTDSEYHSPQKKYKTSHQQPHLQEEEKQEISCLQALFEKPICQEPQETEEKSLRQLINQQQQQQQQIKRNLLLLLTDLKNKQRQLQLHSGLLE